MKKNKLLTAFCLTVISVMIFSCQEKPMTSEKLVSKCADAMGGYDVINNIKTLDIKYIYPDHGNDPLEMKIKRPNLSINPNPDVVFDGKRIFFPKGMDGKSDPVLADEEEWKDGEVEIGFNFPAFFDYPAEFLGIEDVENKQFYKLKVDLPLGAKLTYLIDAVSFLPVKVTADFKIHEKVFHVWHDLSNYKEVDGFKYPFGFTYGSRTGQQDGWIHSLEMNVPLSNDLFKIPNELK